jgi:hypothetical protein
MRRTLGIPIGIALVAGSLVWLIQSVWRPAAQAHPVLLWILGPAPNVVVGLCFPFAGLAFPFASFAGVRRGIVAAALLTAALLVAFEVWRSFPGARTFDPLDIVGSLLGALVGAGVAYSVARRTIR